MASSSSISDTDGHCITAEKLIQFLDEKKKLLLVDLRSFMNYSQCHLDSSINVSIPSTLLKRDNFSLSKLESVITCSQSRQKFKEREGVDVVLYDNDCDKAKNPIIPSLIRKFMEEHLSSSVAYLQGGFSHFLQKHPEYCKNTCSNPSPQPTLYSLCRSAGAIDECDTEPNQILDHLYMGSQAVASNKTTLERHGITYILNTANEIPNFFEGTPGFFYKKVALLDCPSQVIEVDMLRDVFTFIEDAKAKGHKVLVHCRAGQSRSATVVIAYVMWSLRLPLTKAYAFVQEKRAAVSPNLGFIAQLAQLDAKMSQQGLFIPCNGAPVNNTPPTSTSASIPGFHAEQHISQHA